MQKLTAALDLKNRLNRVLKTVEHEFAHLSDEQLRWKPAPDRWSIIECLQHLNLAERYYIRTIQHKVDALAHAPLPPTDQPLMSDWVGKAFRWAVDPTRKTRLPAPGIVRPLTATDLRPADVMSQFLDLQTTLLRLIEPATYLDWNREKIKTLFGNWLTIRVGDALLMVQAHTERHLQQAMRVKAEMNKFVQKN